MLSEGLEQSFKDAQKIVDDEIKAGEYRGSDSEDEEESDEWLCLFIFGIGS